MKRPFNIFPSIGYKNSQFQVIAANDDLNIEVFYKGDHEEKILALQASTAIIHKLDKPGLYIARCKYKGEVFEQEIKVQDAFRLGSSEFKKAFVFDNSEYSFFLMKDRLLLYDEARGELLTENHYSPTEILQISSSTFLFITELGTKTSGIVNLGIYNTESFSIIGELINDYQSIKVSVESNKIWLFKKSSTSVHCFELLSKSGKSFTEIRKFEGVLDYNYDSENERIIIIQKEKVIFADTNNVHAFIEIEKTSNNAIDKQGNNLIQDKSQIILVNELEKYEVNIGYSDNLNLYESDFLHLGTDLNVDNELTDLIEDTNIIKENFDNSLFENKTYYIHKFPKVEVKSEVIIQHYIYPTFQGLFIVKKEIVREFTGVTFKNIEGKWGASPRTIKTIYYSLLFANNLTSKVLIERTTSFKLITYYKHCLIVTSVDRTYLFRAESLNEFSYESSFNFKTIDGNSYLFVEEGDTSSIYEVPNFDRPILEKVNIINKEFIESHKSVWYIGEKKPKSEDSYLNLFDLSSKSKLQLDEKKTQHSLFKGASDYKINQGFILSSNNIIVNPKNAYIKDSVLGQIVSHSSNLSKIVSQRVNHIYLSTFNTSLKKYEEREIKLDINKYQESYLSPNGQFLVLKDENNKYLWYDIEKNKTVKFFSGNFLSFSKEGDLIFEEDGTRTIKIFDPLTFSEITPPNYHHYRFLSPDGKLYSQLSLNTRYFNKLTGDQLNISEVTELRRDLDNPSAYLLMNPDTKLKYVKGKEKADVNRRSFYLENKTIFNEIGIEDYTHITSDTVIKVEKFTKIGIVGTEITADIIFPEDLDYYNYAAFSYDNKYFAYVGKPSSKGLIHIFKLDFDETNNKLLIEDSYLSRYPKYASWVCGFSKTDYFATYDSAPDTYLLKIDEELFHSKTNERELKENINLLKSNIYHQYHKWSVIKEKNYLCFSPTGHYLALSEQGYEPLTLGGYGHQESNTVHIAITETGEIVDSFTGHGAIIAYNNRKKVTFVAFSEDEKRIMTLSSDGVVFVRDVDISEVKNEVKKEQVPVGLSH